MFIDNNGDGLLTAGEPTALTDANGDYLFSDLAPGTKLFMRFREVDIVRSWAVCFQP